MSKPNTFKIHHLPGWETRDVEWPHLGEEATPEQEEREFFRRLGFGAGGFDLGSYEEEGVALRVRPSAALSNGVRQWIVAVSLGGVWEYVQVDSLRWLMQFLGEWAPIIEAASRNEDKEWLRQHTTEHTEPAPYCEHCQREAAIRGQIPPILKGR